MDANEARRLSEQAQKIKQEREKKEEKKLEQDKLAIKKKAEEDVKEILYKIYNKIKEAAAKNIRKVDQWLEYRDERLGRTYLATLIDILKDQLENQNYKVEIIHYDSYGTIYEGTMNPEAVGQEYCSDSALLYIEW